MDSLKKTGVIVGAVFGGVIGGSISLVGKLTNVKVIDDVGSSVVSSSLLMGRIVGDVASGTADTVFGKIRKDEAQVKEGLEDIKGTGKKLVNNVVENVAYLAASGHEIASSIKAKDKPRAVRSAKRLVKWVAVGTITVGVIKMEDSGQSSQKQKPAEKPAEAPTENLAEKSTE
jgi:hypothetical protein